MHPNGDIPEDRGVCADVIIRVYRKVGSKTAEKDYSSLRRWIIRDVYPENEEPLFWTREDGVLSITIFPQRIVTRSK